MFRKSIIAVLLAGGLVPAFSGCKKYLDVNRNPNIATEVQPALLLPTSQLAVASALGVDMNIIGSIWVQYFTQSPAASQYIRLEQYQPDAPQFDRAWALLYSSALQDLRRMDEIAQQQNLTQYRAIAQLMMAYTFQLTTDAWGDVPFTEALRGEEGVSNPRFDPQQQIYDSLIRMVDFGLALASPDDPTHPGDDDLVYGGDMSQWERFGNTLKLKLFMRMSEVNPSRAQQGIASLSGASFIEEDDDAQINYQTTAGNQNPLYSEVVGLGRTQNLVASATVVDSMNANEDARVSQFFNPTGGRVVGLQQGNYRADPSTPVSAPSALTGALGATASGQTTAAAPVRFLSSYESLLLQAEAAARGWGTGSDEDLFNRAVEVNFETFGADEDDYEYYIDSTYWGIYPTGASTQQKVRHIITQKWFCMTGNQGIEAWTEWRRTGYPDFLVISANSRIGNNIPTRFLYPASELTRNAAFPGQRSITDRVWWDVR